LVVPGSGTRISLTSHSVQTQSHARILRQYLEQLDDTRRGRQQALNRAHNLASGDDIAPRIRRMAAGLERWTQVKPEMFEEAMVEEMTKYDRFRNEITGSDSKQQDLLRSAEVRLLLLLNVARC
jgi:programmed cell death 6-interacting protein